MCQSFSGSGSFSNVRITAFSVLSNWTLGNCDGVLLQKNKNTYFSAVQDSYSRQNNRQMSLGHKPFIWHVSKKNLTYILSVKNCQNLIISSFL